MACRVVIRQIYAPRNRYDVFQRNNRYDRPENSNGKSGTTPQIGKIVKPRKVSRMGRGNVAVQCGLPANAVKNAGTADRCR